MEILYLAARRDSTIAAGQSSDHHVGAAVDALARTPDV
jgi:hypothetical protein